MRKAVAIIGTTLMLAALSAAPASAELGVASGGPPAGAVCATDNYVKACFAQNGDDIYVYDAEKDGASAVARWSLSGGGSGFCRNQRGYGTWVKCDKNFTECFASGANNTFRWENWTYDADLADWNFISGPYAVWVSPNRCPQPV